MVTAEAAVALPVLVFLALTGVTAVGVAQDRVRCVDAAREAARAIARGDTATAGTAARLAAGRPIDISTVTTGAYTTVTVRLTVRPLRWPGGLTMVESATAASEGRS